VSSTTELVAKARFLRNASPQAYDEFCKAVENYAESATATLIMASENTQLHQGYVRQCLAFMTAFEEAKNG
jgi:hypothetical protein